MQNSKDIESTPGNSMLPDEKKSAAAPSQVEINIYQKDSPDSELFQSNGNKDNQKIQKKTSSEIMSRELEIKMNTRQQCIDKIMQKNQENENKLGLNIEKGDSSLSQSKQSSNFEGSEYGDQTKQERDQKMNLETAEKNQQFPRNVKYLSFLLFFLGVVTFIAGFFFSYFFIISVICLIPGTYYIYKFYQFKKSKDFEQKEKVLDGIQHQA